MIPEKIWPAVLGELEVTLSRANFTTWFKNTNLEGVQGEIARVTVPNAFTKEWLRRKYLDDVLEALKRHVPEVASVEFVVGRPATSANPAPAAPVVEDSPGPRTATPTMSRGGGRMPQNTFENFVVGGSNQLAHAAARAVTNDPGGTYNPLFLYGGAGLGKTHLMQAIGRAIEETSDKKVLYVTTEKFTNELISAISQNRTAAFKNRYRKVDVLLIDDVQFLAGKETMQEEFFHTFNALHQDGKQVVLTSDRPPKAIPTLEERLRSRFEWGLTADLAPPELETRAAILRAKARDRHYEVSDEVLDFIARSIQQNIRELEGALIRIMAHAELTGTPPTKQLAEQVLGSVLAARHQRHLTSTQVIDAVSKFYDISVEAIKGQGRQREIVKPRQMAMFLLREEANLSYPKIGREIGGRDHTTVIHAVEKVGGEIEGNEPLRHELNLLKERLYA
jgi:chromosomal replication initiator protein